MTSSRTRIANSNRPGVSTCRDRRSALIFPLLIVACGWAAFANSFSGVFVFDDYQWIVENPSVRQLWPPWKPAGGTLRPLLFYTLAANYAVSGLAVQSYHAVNITIHVLAALTLYGLVRRTLVLPIFGGRFARCGSLYALSVALIWVVHPIQTQSVTYVIQRGECLMGFLYLLTLYCVVRGEQGVHERLWYVAAVIAFQAALACKEVAATAPVVVLLYDRAFLTQSLIQSLRRRWHLYAALIAPGLLIVVAWIVGGSARLSLFTPNAHVHPPGIYALTQLRVLVHYLRLSVWPGPLCLDYTWPTVTDVFEVAPAAVMIAGLVAVTLWGCARRRPWSFVGLWFFVILAPTSSFMPLGDCAMEHRMYLPLAAPVIAAVFACQSVTGRFVKRRRQRAAVLCAIGATAIAGLAWRTVVRNRDYHSEVRLWSSVVALRPHNPRAHYNLGSVLHRSGQTDEAVEHLQEALRLKPDYPQAHNNLGKVWAESGRIHEARACFMVAVRLEPAFAEAQNNLGAAFAAEGRIDQAEAHYREALRIDPQLAEAHNNIGSSLVARGQVEAATFHFRRAVKAKPDFAAARVNLANVLMKAGNAGEAIVQYRATLGLIPENAVIRNNLGTALYRLGRTEEALTEYRRALRLDPGFEDARVNLEAASHAPRTRE